MKKYLFLLLSFTQFSFSQNDAEIDPSFITGTGFNGPVNSICIQSDGKILVGGIFSIYNGVTKNNIIRLNQDGSIDTSFNIGSGFSNYVNIIKVQSNGKILVFGNYSTYNELPCNNLIRLNNDGSKDNSFTLSNISNTVESMEINLNDKIYLGGFFSENFGFKNKLMRLNPNGDIDNSFNVGTGFANDNVKTLKIQTDGKLIVSGTFTNYNGTTVPNLIRLNIDGSIDNTFSSNQGFDSFANSFEIRNDDTIYAVGNFSQYYWQSIAGQVARGICRINVNGTKNSTIFNNGSTIGFDLSARAAKFQSDNKLIVVGDFSSFNNTNSNKIIRLNSDGTIDNSFIIGTGFNSFSNSLCLIQDGRILVGGQFTSYNGIQANRIVRLKGTFLSTKQFQKSNIEIYPNPAKEIIWISNVENLDFEIYNLVGKKILSGQHSKNEINITSLTKGIYILKIKNGEQIVNQKFIKE